MRELPRAREHATGTETGDAAPTQAFRTSRKAVAPGGGRPVDTEIGNRRPDREQNRLISSDFREALWRTRTADPLLTMEVPERHARARAITRDTELTQAPFFGKSVRADGSRRGRRTSLRR